MLGLVGLIGGEVVSVLKHIVVINPNDLKLSLWKGIFLSQTQEPSTLFFSLSLLWRSGDVVLENLELREDALTYLFELPIVITKGLMQP